MRSGGAEGVLLSLEDALEAARGRPCSTFDCIEFCRALAEGGRPARDGPGDALGGFDGSGSEPMTGEDAPIDGDLVEPAAFL